MISYSCCTYINNQARFNKTNILQKENSLTVIMFNKNGVDSREKTFQ